MSRVPSADKVNRKTIMNPSGAAHLNPITHDPDISSHS